MLSTLNLDDTEYAQALKCARGVYQLGLLRGVYEWTGNDLQGAALNWSWQYELSRRSVLTRLDKNNIKFAFFVLPWFVLKPVLLIGVNKSINPSDETRKYFMKALKYSDVAEALKATLAYEFMFTDSTSYVATLTQKHHMVKHRRGHYHLSWKDIKNAEHTDNRKQNILQGDRSSHASSPFEDPFPH